MGDCFYKLEIRKAMLIICDTIFRNELFGNVKTISESF